MNIWNRRKFSGLKIFGGKEKHSKCLVKFDTHIKYFTVIMSCQGFNNIPIRKSYTYTADFNLVY